MDIRFSVELSNPTDNPVRGRVTMDQSGADPLLDQLSERLGQILTNPEMLEASQTIAQAVTEALEGVEVSPDTVKEVAIAALGGAIERAENAVTSAENLLRGR